MRSGPVLFSIVGNSLPAKQSNSNLWVGMVFVMFSRF